MAHYLWVSQLHHHDTVEVSVRFLQFFLGGTAKTNHEIVEYKHGDITVIFLSTERPPALFHDFLSTTILPYERALHFTPFSWMSRTAIVVVGGKDVRF
jgi:hypothetical protein